MSSSTSIYDQSLEYLKGVGPAKAEILKKELNLSSIGDLVYDFPFRYIDRSVFSTIKNIYENNQIIQLKGKLGSIKAIKGKNRRTRLVSKFTDASGSIELVWFQGVSWIEKVLVPNDEYILFGRVNIFNGKKSIIHPELESTRNPSDLKPKAFEPVYHSTDKLNAKGLDSKGRRKILKLLIHKLNVTDLPENIPRSILDKLKLMPRLEAVKTIHFPENPEILKAAQNRIKFEEFFFLQLRMLHNKKKREHKILGAKFTSIGKHFTTFFNSKLSFELTGAQKKVLKEIRANLGSGIQMNRLLQGDVGSGKTVVGLMTMLIALDNGYQACMMAPTEILAQQHYQSISEELKGLGIRTAFLSGTVKGKKRKELLKFLADGEIDILIGTHALIEDPVVFKNLGLAITDEQHRFGVAQRAKLWHKNKQNPPHILVMTATPIPRTLAMTVYGDLDVSVIDELPPGRKHIKTVHQLESKRPQVLKFMHHEIKKGRQIYVVFPLIEESETLDLQNLQEGYEQLLHYFPMPTYQISVVHGRMKAAEKEAEMQRFVTKKTQIMVATTVIEVGVNVPNASVMVIENAERFGLSQLHQLRGRVGRGADQSYCVLMSGYKLSKNAKERIHTMTSTNNGFEIAEVDMRLRGPGDIEGTMQSGALDFKLANIVQDQAILQTARHIAQMVLEVDPDLSSDENIVIRDHLRSLAKINKNWGLIS